MLTSTLLTVLPALTPAQDDPIPLDFARQAFREAEEAAVADGGKLWGRELLGPLLFADPTTRAVVANQPDEAERLVEADGVFTGTLPAEIGIANTAVAWAGVRWTMVRWPLPADRHARTALLLHESFHRIQPELGHGGGDPPNPHLDGEDGRTWLRLEFRALAAALQVPRGARRAQAMYDALAFRAQRRALFPDAERTESALERNEGLAEYTGLKLCGLAPAAQAERAAVRLIGDEKSANFGRSFAYATGPAYGVLLDGLWPPPEGNPADQDVDADAERFDPGPWWRSSINGGTDLGELLGRAAILCGPRMEDRAAEAPRLADRYGGPAIVAEERARAVERAAADARNRARFVDGPVLVLPFVDMSYSFDPNDVTPLEPEGSVYGTVYLVDAWGVLDVKAGGCLFVRNSGGWVEARMPAPPDPRARPLAGDGWTLTLNAGWTLAPGTRASDWKVARAD